MRRRVEDNVDMVLRAEVNAVAIRQSVAVHLLSVDEGPVLASLIDDAVLAVHQDDLGVIARDAWVGDDEVLLRPAADGEWYFLQRDLALLLPFDKHQIGILPGNTMWHGAGKRNSAMEGVG